MTTVVTNVAPNRSYTITQPPGETTPRADVIAGANERAAI